MSSTIPKKVFAAIACLFSFGLYSQSLDGAWEATMKNEKGINTQYVIIISDGYISEAFFEKKTGKFDGTWGGSFQASNGTFSYVYEFASFDPDLVGTTKSGTYVFIDGKLKIGDNLWTRIDDGSPGELDGAWLISGRMRDGKIQQRDTDRPRKTMKILSGTRFQWIAYNTETKQFMGTGGGTYTSVDGKYTENIQFFSRDDSRVGASLSFDFELKDGAWHHSGNSSKGTPIHEIWSKRQ
ncbi:membrane or secreted protein [Flagellimonas allohymeniacidonis]|uniref:Membrane or secreted protein n=1 Tax=Flagellimonas allohymeniacidonis TaxID=2517819 RepID=A0A4Q8QDV8_9FLAO|nr:membrane or secreted protein [Allomuricauda hymeniacidonis]TAI47757.1 membrane or secreted protein [Allomuricauda hymeniacidonis]